MPALSLRQPRTRDAGPVDPAIAAGRARPSPLILFGAFDRHNLGDLLLGRIAGALAEASAPGRPLLFAGAASRDLREAGGEQVHGLDALIEHWQRESAHDPQRLPPDLLQAGGEILGCTAWEAAVMLEAPDHAAALIRAHDRDLAGRKAWARLRARLAAPADCIVAASTSLLELCALLAGCTLCLASSLHARIVAEAFARPAASLVLASARGQGDKLRAYLETWHGDSLHLHHLEAAGAIGAAGAALAEPERARHARAAELAGLAETAFQRCLDALTRS